MRRTIFMAALAALIAAASIQVSYAQGGGGGGWRWVVAERGGCRRWVVERARELAGRGGGGGPRVMQAPGGTTGSATGGANGWRVLLPPMEGPGGGSGSGGQSKRMRH